MIYKGYKINEVFHYSNVGTSDFSVFPPESEVGYMEHDKTLQEVMEAIDEEIKDKPETYENRPATV